MREMAGGQLTLRAISLVYTTLMSLVPLLAFSFSLLKGAGVHRQMEPLLQNFLAPLGVEQSAALTAQIVRFVDNLQGALLGGVGLIFLVFVVVSMVQKIEASLNYIWRVEAGRSMVRKVGGYLSAMLLGPLLMALALGLIATISSVTLVQRLMDVELLGSVLTALGRLLPYALLAVLFSLIYLALPNTRVRMLPAAVGGVFGGFAWAAASSVFAQVVAASTRISAVYSSFAIVILALIWLYVSWMIMLLGAQLAYYVQHPEHLRDGRRHPELSALAREHVGLAAMLLVAREFLIPEHPWRASTLAARFRLPPESLAPVLAALTEAGLLVETVDGHLLPGRALEAIRLVDVLGATRGRDEIVAPLGDRWSAQAREIWRRSRRGTDTALRDHHAGRPGA
jgi:membrane protein